MKVISIIDTSVCEYNLGNQIIMESVYRELNELFHEDFFYNIPYQIIKGKSLKVLKSSNFKFFGGTNSLSSFMNKYKQWDVNLYNYRYVSGLILIGLGWWQYQEDPNLYTKFLLKKTLSSEFYHSVRDSYTEKKLSNLGIKVINTGCPTLWAIDDNTLKKINKIKSKNLVLTLTDYNKKPLLDKQLVECCIKNYDTVYLWPQGVGDYSYIKDLGFEGKLSVLAPKLHDFDKILEDGDIDYIGTRLHAGIRAIQKSRKAIIIGIDNRAKEMGQDFGLPIISRDDVRELEKRIHSDYLLNLKIPFENITKWKKQFK
ncbi:polysaccharide pyruvyl transferase family protein [Clostridium thermarum]|uniref:polysaccharide pyruvyl transferase family protein n=1 Tax=Clostridium thermarum TaxID=1716543 RepID=UPI00111ED5B0|nr:polysaccharide pyruvyl transferase family protein [Clostridium thermarum]